ncbi:MAG: ATP-dependent zinc metalloprotease FtsH [Bacteroidales bacterium]
MSENGKKRPPREGGPNGNQGNTPPKKNNRIYWIYGAMVLALLLVTSIRWGEGVKEITWLEFEREMLLKHHVEKIVVVNNKVVEVYISADHLTDTIHSEKYKVDVQGFNDAPNPGPHYQLPIVTLEQFERRFEELQNKLITQDTTGLWDKMRAEDPEFSPADYQAAAEKIRMEVNIPIQIEERREWGKELSWLIPLILIVVVWIFLMRMMGRGGPGGGQIFNIGKSKAQLFDRDTMVKVNFNDVAGLEEAKVEIMEIVDFLKNPKKYTNLGGKIPKGALLVGPPGTGKTLLAKAVAGEAQVPFFSISGSDFVEMFVGVGASRVRDLFRQAKEKAPCIIFIDEIDAIGRARGKNAVTGANDERENTLNQLLTEMDGFSTNSGVIILAATNRADILDRALLRAGRFDRQIHVELPDLNERLAIFKVHMKPLKVNPEVSVDFLAKQTPGFSGADIANVCNESALIAARRGKPEIGKQDFLDAIDRIIGGLEKRNKIISKDEKAVIAFHEAGHASISWLVEHAHPLVKVTIIPRGKALGAAWYLPEERQITTYDQMFAEITAALGGRAAEEVIFGRVSTGALNDLEKVTKQAYAMVAYFGLNKEIGNLSYYDSTGQQEYNFNRPYSEKTAEIIDQEVKALVESAYQRAVNLLQDNKEQLEQLAKVLLEKEVIFSEDLEKIYGKSRYQIAHPEKPDDNGVVTSLPDSTTENINDSDQSAALTADNQDKE